MERVKTLAASPTAQVASGAALVTVIVGLVLFSGSPDAPQRAAQQTASPARPAQTPAATPSAAVIATTPLPAASPPPTPRPLGSPSPIPLPSYAQLSAPTGNVVWALVASSRLFVSADGGSHWQERPLPSEIDGLTPSPQISFISEREGWMLTPGAPGCPQSQSARLWHTADGASTWRALDLSGLADSTCKDVLSFVDARRGFLTGHAADGGPIVYATTDGGRSWRASQPLPMGSAPCGRPSGGPCIAGQVRVFGQQLLVDVAVHLSGRITRSVFHSSDGAASWTLAADVPDPRGALVIVTLSRWLEIGNDGDSRETSDAGRSWHGYSSDFSTAAPVAPAITFGSEQVGYATVRGFIRRTTDGGVHWTSLTTPGTR